MSWEDESEGEVAKCTAEIQKNSNIWLGLAKSTVDERAARSEAMQTDHFFRFLTRHLVITYGKNNWRNGWFDHLVTYSSCDWVPEDFSRASVRRCQRLIDAWVKEDSSLEDLKLSDRENAAYFTSDNTRIYVELIIPKNFFDLWVHRRKYVFGASRSAIPKKAVRKHID